MSNPNIPQPRDIPAGKILLAEYGTYPDSERSQVETIAKAFAAAVRAEVALQFATPGFECAGSCARWTNGYWAVRWHQWGAIQGRRYSPTDQGETEARVHYARLTAPA